MEDEGWDFLSHSSKEELARTQAQQPQSIQEWPNAHYGHFMQMEDNNTAAGTSLIGRFATKEELADLMTVKSVESAVAMVVDVHANFGRLLIPENIRKPELVVYFDLNTTLDGQSIGAMTNNAQDVVYPGLLVEIVIQTSTANAGPTGKIASGVVRCTGMVTYDEHCRYNLIIGDNRSMEQQTPAEDALKEEAVMVVGVRASGFGGAVTANQEMVLLHSHIVPDDRLVAAISAHFTSPSAETLRKLSEWKPISLNDCDLMAAGRVLLARVAIIPSWIREMSAGLRNVHCIATTVRSNGDTRQGMGRIVKYLEKGGLLESIDGDPDIVYFAIEFLPKTRGTDVQIAWPLDSCLLYEACRELPGRQFEWRAFRLMDMGEPVVASRTETLASMPEETMVTSAAGDSRSTPRARDPMLNLLPLKKRTLSLASNIHPFSSASQSISMKSALELITNSDLSLSDMEVEMLKLLAPQSMKYLGL